MQIEFFFFQYLGTGRLGIIEHLRKAYDMVGCLSHSPVMDECISNCV